MDPTGTSPPDVRKPPGRRGPQPWALVALFVPGGLFMLGLVLMRDQPRFRWLADVRAYPWELWVIALCGSVATAAGALDYRYHRSGKTVIGGAEHRSELLALALGG